MKYIPILVLALLLSACSTQKAVKEKPFTVDFSSPRVSLGTIEVQIDNMIPILEIKKTKVNVDYYPAEDAVCLRYRIDLMTFYQYFNKEGRDVFFSALEQYKKDYEQKALKTKGSKKTRRQYGKFQSYLIWQAFAYTVRSRANHDVEFGYDIKSINNNRAAFFIIYRKEAIFENELNKQDTRRVAPNMPMYLSRAQADELAEYFNEELLKTVATTGVKKYSEDIDEY